MPAPPEELVIVMIDDADVLAERDTRCVISVRIGNSVIGRPIAPAGADCTSGTAS